jgi:hypothetical protein
MKTKLAISLLIVCALLLMGSALRAPSAPSIIWQVLGGGGGRLASGSVTLEGTVGQPVVGFVNQSPVNLCSGYWCGTEPGYQRFLPFVRR